MKEVFDELLGNPILQTVGTSVMLTVIALWLAASWWAYQDASRRKESTLAGFAAAGWIILSTPLMLPLALAVYTMARPQATASDERTVNLMARLNEVAADRPMCPGCEAAVDPDWLRCPWCASWFELDCDACGEWSAVGLDVCPFCGADRDPVPAGWVTDLGGHGRAAAGEPAAALGGAGVPRLQRGRVASSWRPASYEASRASSSVSS